MKKLLIIAILLINMKTMSQENNLFFDHQALIVNNLQKSGDFYLDILGLQEIPVGAVKIHLKDGLKLIMAKKYI